MTIDPHGTRRRIFTAAVEEFAAYGSAGARIDRIATRAQANKESIYRYYGTKEQLLRRVLDQYLGEHGEELLPDTDDLPRYVADSLAHFAANPEFLRLSGWEGLEFGAELDPTAVENRGRYYQAKLAAITAQQRAGTVDPELDPRHLLLVLNSLASYWLLMPQIVRLVLGEDPDVEARQRHEKFIAECVHRIVAPTSPHQPAPTASDATASHPDLDS